MEHITVKDIVKAVDGRLLCGSGDVSLSHISIDSRTMKGSDLFVPLIGEKTDAHAYISQAVSNGAVAVLTSEHDRMEDQIPWIRVADTKKALQAIGAYYRRRLTLPLVGITGSVGKTTTRELIAQALSAGYQVFKTPGNHNSQVGVPITLTEIGGGDQIGVLELGMSEPGELTVIAQIARVHMAVITNIGVAHIEQLGSRENICREKLTIQDGLIPGGLLILNGDDDLLKNTAAREGFRTIYYGTGENCDYRACDIELEDGRPVFTAVHGKTSVRVRLGVMGMHQVLNAMAALAVADQCRVPMEAAAAKLEEYSGYKNRQQIYETNQITVIDDTYNASPDSMKAAAQVLCSLKTAGRRIAVLADMKELGENSPVYHYEVGEFLAKQPIDELVVLGGQAREIARGAADHTDRIKIRLFDDKIRLMSYLDEEVKAGDCVLFKGSNSMKLDEAAKRLLQDKE